MKAKQELNKKSSDNKTLIEGLITRWDLTDDDCSPSTPSYSEIMDRGINFDMDLTRTILAKGLLAQNSFFKKKKEDTYCGFAPGFLIGKKF